MATNGIGKCLRQRGLQQLLLSDELISQQLRSYFSSCGLTEGSGDVDFGRGEEEIEKRMQVTDECNGITGEKSK